MTDQELQLTFKNGLDKKISNNIMKMLSIWDLRYFGEFSARLNYIKREGKNFTCAVNVSMRGPNFYWGEEFVNKMTEKATCFVIIHECCHLLFRHPKRGMSYDKLASNYVMDMLINQIIRDKILLQGTNQNHIEEPKDELNFNTCLYVPKEYDGALFFEELYVWWMKQVDRRRKEREEQGIGQNADFKMPDGTIVNLPTTYDDEMNLINNLELNVKTKEYGKFGLNDAETFSLNDILDGFITRKTSCLIGEDMADEVPEELRDSIISAMKDSLKNRGLAGGNMEQILNELYKSEVNYLKLLKRAISQHLFRNIKYSSILKPSRKGVEGLKGKKKRSNMLNCILDTSGSMYGDFEHVLSYIFHNDIHLNLIQIDTEVKGVQVIKNKNELKKVDIKGLGGTMLQPGIDYIASNKELNSNNTLILTDGYTDNLDFGAHKHNVLILTCGVECTVTNNQKVKQIIIPNKKK